MHRVVLAVSVGSVLWVLAGLLMMVVLWKAGFGMLRSGMWIAPGLVDVAAMLPEPTLRDHVQAFRAEPLEWSAVDQMVRDAYDLPAIAGRYRRFLRRWDAPRPLPSLPDDLARHLWLISEWLLILRDDPRIPLPHLPPEWPAVEAETVFRRRYDTLGPRAHAILDELLDAVDVPVRDGRRLTFR